MLKADEIEVLEPLTVAVIPDFWDHVIRFLMDFLYFNYVSLSMRGPDLYCLFQAWTDKRFVEWQHHFSVLVLEIAGNYYYYYY